MAVRKRGNTFTITLSLGYDEQGKQIRKHTTYTPPVGVTEGKALKLAKEYAVMWESKIKGYTSLDENRTFRQLFEWYYETVAPVALKENIAIDNKSIIETYIMPTLGNVKLKNIAPQMLDNLFRTLEKSGRTAQFYKLKDTSILDKVNKSKMEREIKISRTTVARIRDGHNCEKEIAEKVADYLDKRFDDIFIDGIENRALATSSVSRIRRCLSAIFTAAVKKEIIRRNPVSNTESISKARQSAAVYLDEQQAANLLSALENQPDEQFKAMITMLLFTGMRGGELLGLKWEDVELEKGIIYIRNTLAYNRGNKSKGKEKYSLQTPKTKKSERYVLLPKTVIEILKEQKLRQEERRKAFGDDWRDRGTVFCTVNGEYYSESYLNKKFKILAKKIGLPNDIHIHSLRHTTASLLINSGISPKLISEQLGHASTTITQDLYAHVFASSKANVMQALEMKLLPNVETEE